MTFPTVCLELHIGFWIFQIYSYRLLYMMSRNRKCQNCAENLKQYFNLIIQQTITAEATVVFGLCTFMSGFFLSAYILALKYPLSGALEKSRKHTDCLRFQAVTNSSSLLTLKKDFGSGAGVRLLMSALLKWLLQTSVRKI